MSTIKDFQDEFQNGRIGDFNYPLVVNVADDVCWKYPPEIYSPEGVWDEDNILQIADEFFVNVLLEKGRLSYHLLTQESVSGLKNVIYGDFRNFLRSKNSNSISANLYRRLLSILSNSDLFVLLHNHPQRQVQVFGLSGKHDKQTEMIQRIEIVIQAMFLVELPPLIRYRDDSKKRSHLLSTDDLEKLILRTFEIVDKAIRVDMLINALRYRLNLLDANLVSIYDEISNTSETENLLYLDVIPNNDLPTELNITCQEVSSGIYERLSDRQRIIFALKVGDHSIEEIGRIVGVSKSTVSSEFKKVERVFSSVKIMESEFETVFQIVSKLCDNFMNATNGPAQSCY